MSLTDTGENVQKWTRVFYLRCWVILVARTRRKKEKIIACPLLDIFACGQVSSPRLYRLTEVSKLFLVKFFRQSFETGETCIYLNIEVILGFLKHLELPLLTFSVCGFDIFLPKSKNIWKVKIFAQKSDRVIRAKNSSKFRESIIWQIWANNVAVLAEFWGVAKLAKMSHGPNSLLPQDANSQSIS